MPRVLVVDDDPELQEILSLVLGHEGFEVVPAYDGVAALEALIGENIDVVLLDVMMPGMNGFEVCRKLKQHPPVEAPVIFLSAKTQPGDIKKAFECGAHDYITKPFRHEDLVDRIKMALQAKEASFDQEPS